MTDQAALLEYLEVAKRAARAGGETLLGHFEEAPRNVRVKDRPSNLVSDADEHSERVILEELARSTDLPVLTEEQGAIHEYSGGLRWIVDPLDGTQNYLRGIPLWCVSIALEEDGAGVVGVVYDPVHDELFEAASGSGARMNGRELPLSKRPEEFDEMILVGSYRRATGSGTTRLATLADLPGAFGSTRELIAAALELAWTAAGRFDVLYHESRIQHWDLAAGLVLCRESGLAVRQLPVAPGGRRPRLLVSSPATVDRLLGIVD